MASKAKTAETKEKAPAGSSITAQCKQLVLAVASEVAEHGAMLQDTLDWLNNVAAQIASTQQRGLPPQTRLENLQAEVSAIYAAGEVIDGAPVFTTEQSNRLEELFVKINRVKRDIRKAESEAAA